MADSDNGPDAVWDLLEKISIGMVVTHDGLGGDMRARPMAARLARDENAIYFLTDANSGKVYEVDQDQSVCLSFADNREMVYVSVTGRASVSNDRDRIREFWTVADRAFWRDATDPAIRLLRVEADAAEYWRSSGGVLTAIRLAMAGLTGARPRLGDNEKVALKPTS